MLFNSVEFLLFFIVVYALYLVLSHTWQNRLLLVASCLFYAAWSWKFLFLMFASISVDFVCSQYIFRTQNPARRRFFLCLSLFVNFSILGFFKYCNFFIENLQSLLQSFSISHPLLNSTLEIILPLGISFYTFEAISYVMDVYRSRTQPAKKYWDYVLFVIYFPHLIAGPIMRAKDFLPQIVLPRRLSLGQFYEGCHLIFWGLFEKIFIADNLAKIVNPVFAGAPPYKGGEVLVALYAFAFQIFCDFDGYSNMARGLGKCMGFEIAINFKLPYFSVNPKEFWQRWHITLSSWLRDYLYIPLGGNRGGIFKQCASLFVTMLLGGLWHGASWTFVLWGAYHGILVGLHRVILRFGGWKSVAEPGSQAGQAGGRILKTIFFFHMVTIGWLLFRATSLHQVGEMFYAMGNIFHEPGFWELFLQFSAIIGPLMIVQYGQLKTGDLLFLFKTPKIVKIGVYALMTYLILGFGVMRAEEFIYFQF